VLPHPSFSGVNINTSVPGTIVVTWTGTQGVTLPDLTHLMDITFTYISGTTSLTWNTTGTACQYHKYQGGSQVVLNDTPKPNYYINGVMTSHAAPVTLAPVLPTAVPGAVSLPFRVVGFTNIGSLTLSLSYNPNVLTFLGTYTPNPAFTSNFLVGSQPGFNGNNLLVIQWFGNSTTLADSSILVSVNFTFSNAQNTGNHSALSWFDNGPSSQYTDGLGNSLYDLPASWFYKDGMVATQVSPVTQISFTANATPGSTVPVDLHVNGFTNLTSLSLAFKYDPAVLTLPPGAFIPNPVFGSSMIVTNNAAGADGKRTLVLTWSGTATTLDPGSSLVTLNFTYSAGSSVLQFLSGSDSCNYKDIQNNSLWKSPFESFYVNGAVTAHAAPKTRVANMTGVTGQPVTIPVKVTGFGNIGNFTLTLLFDPGVLSTPSATAGPSLGGALSSLAPEPGQLVVQWTGPPLTLPDSSVLLNLLFTDLGGVTPLQWYWAGGSCRYAEGPSLPALFDIPQSQYYLHGMLTRAPLLNAVVFLEGPYNSGVMATTLPGLGVCPLSQPYSGSPWNYNGTETVTSIPFNTTDWILVELRTQTAASSRVTRRAGFIKADGSIRELDGTGLLGFPGTGNGNYYVVLHHRNHLSVMSAAPVALTSASSLYDFTLGPSAVYGGSSGYKEIDHALGKWGMVAGDGNCNGSIYTDDFTTYWVPSFGWVNVYNPGDYDLDGNVFINDNTDLWMKNFGISNPLP